MTAFQGTGVGAAPEDAALVRGRRSLGVFELTFCSDGTYLLDGGAMFGVVPKTLWQKRIAADETNRIRLGLNTVVVRTGSAVVLIETGIGNKQSAKMREIHANQELLPASLAAAGVRVEEVTHVVNTHLHFDHCGWNTTLHEDGSVTPTFQNAKYFAAAGELAHGRLQLDRDRVSYLGPNYDPLIAAGQLTLIDLDGVGGFTPDDARLRGPESLPEVAILASAEIVPGVWVERFPGHTADMLGVHVESAGERACYVGDLIPTHHHLDATWVMGYDLDPLTCIEQRKRFLKRAIEERWLVMFTHDHDVPFGYLAWGEKGKPVLASSRNNTDVKVDSGCAQVRREELAGP
jgi:glyoxylase-like metal-dependent hydrolase (beta-lactamase superfamily II)